MDLIPIGKTHVSEHETRKTSSRFSGTYVESGDLLVAKITPSFENGKQAIVDWDCDFGYATTEVIPLQPLPEESDVRFLANLLLMPEIRADLAGKMEGTTGRQRLSKTVLGARAIPLPPLPEQRKIAAMLSLVQRAIEQQDRLIALTTELKRSLMHKLFTEGLHGEPQKQTEIGPVPDSWSLVSLSEICNFLSGGTPSKKRSDFWEGDIPWVSPKDMKRERLADVSDHVSREAVEAGSAIAPRGSVIVVVRGMILARDVPVCLLKVPMAFNQDVKAILPSDRMQPDFLLYALIQHKSELARKVGRSAHGTYTLLSSEIARMQIPVPSLDEQAEISNAICTVEEKAQLHTKQAAALRDLFRTLLHQLMTAQIRVDDFDLTALEASLAKAGCEPVDP